MSIQNYKEPFVASRVCADSDFVNKYLPELRQKGYEIYQVSEESFVTNCPIKKLQKLFKRK